jgi:5-methylthioadenosine/S-adenosylhomocysteine deaminase
VKVAVSPHSIYTVCKNNLIKSKELSDKYGTILHIHVAETKKEFDDSIKNN